MKLKNDLKILSIIYSSQPINSSITRLFSKFSKENNINYLSYISNEKKIFDFFLPWQRKLNFACNTEDKSIKNILNKNYDDVQFIDSDIDYI
jgi:uridine kinase